MITTPPEVVTASDKILLITFAALTHRLERITTDTASAAARAEATTTVRLQRDQVEDEILRRMAGAR